MMAEPCRNTILSSGSLPDGQLEHSSFVLVSATTEMWTDETGQGAVSHIGQIGVRSELFDDVPLLSSRVQSILGGVTDAPLESADCVFIGAASEMFDVVLPGFAAEIGEIGVLSEMFDVVLPLLSAQIAVEAVSAVSISRVRQLYIINPTTGAISTHSAAPTHICAHDGVLYGSTGTSLVSFDGAVLTPTLQTGQLQFGQKSKLRKVTLGVDTGTSTVVHSLDGQDFPQTVRSTADTDVEHSTNRAYEGRDHQLTVTFAGELRYVDLSVVSTQRERGQNDG